MSIVRFLIDIEKANGNFSVYCPDLPACVASGKTREETEDKMYEALEMHIRGLIEVKIPIPESEALVEYIAFAV